ncbi:MAG: 23S rRNA (uracil(1939)-C(5))-methyltransferase RlmD [Candidatus Caccovivens sp.]
MKKEIKIFDVSYEGAGVGKIDGKVVFVPKTLPDEIALVEVPQNSKKYVTGTLLQVVNPSERRVDAFCPYFDICGGCAFQHCDYEYEKLLKVQILKNELKKTGYDGDISFCESKDRYFYRNKIKLSVHNGRLGYFKARSRNFFEVDFCPIASKEINEAIGVIKQFVETNCFADLKSVYVKQVDQAISVCFLFAQKSKINAKKCKNLQILSTFSVFFAYGDVLESNDTKIFCVCGKEKFMQKVGDDTIEVDVSGFNQVNDDVAKKLYDYLCQFCLNKRVINAYSGQGLLTFLLAKQAKFVYGIEYQISAHQSAVKLEEKCDRYCMKNICGKVEDELARVLASDRIDVMIVDPAREGCKIQVLEAVKNSKIPEFVYVSCDFSTLVRDLKVLRDFYTIQSVKIFDMFPCTARMETVVVLKRSV